MAKSIPVSYILDFSQEEKQMIRDALYNYQCRLYELSKNNHFTITKDIFAQDYRTCITLIEQIDEKWDVM